eukprot:s3008_g4.t1
MKPAKSLKYPFIDLIAVRQLQATAPSLGVEVFFVDADQEAHRAHQLGIWAAPALLFFARGSQLTVQRPEADDANKYVGSISMDESVDISLFDDRVPTRGWYQKFEALGEDSDTEAEAVPEVLDVQTERLLKALPPDVAESVRSTTNPRVREALLAINCFVSELHGPMEKTPARQQQLLQALSAALKSLEEGGEVETLLFRMRSVLQHPEVRAEKVEQALGACALLRGHLDKRILLTIANASLDRLRELSAPCLARLCWSAASLQSGEAHEDLRRLLHSAMELAEGRQKGLIVRGSESAE